MVESGIRLYGLDRQFAAHSRYPERMENATASAQANKRDVSHADGRCKADHALLARLVIREGKPFCSSAIQAGYAEHTAGKGLRRLMSESRPLADAIQRETNAIESDIVKLKPLAITRLYREIADYDSPNGMKAIELAGRFKETDWFVRSTDQNIGVFLALTEQSSVNESDKYKE